jgi:endonuclease G
MSQYGWQPVGPPSNSRPEDPPAVVGMDQVDALGAIDDGDGQISVAEIDSYRRGGAPEAGPTPEKGEPIGKDGGVKGELGKGEYGKDQYGKGKDSYGAIEERTGWVPDQQLATLELGVAEMTGEGSLLQVSAPGTDRLLLRQGYANYYDAELKSAGVVAYQLSARDIARVSQETGGANLDRRNRFRADGDAGGTGPKNADYTGSGYDRGHHFPTADSSTYSIQDEGYLLTNMSPQTAQLNRGGWRKLEAMVRDQIADSGGTGTVLSGSLYLEGGPRPLSLDGSGRLTGSTPDTAVGERMTKDGGVPVPSHSFKVVLIEGAGGMEMHAWVVSNDSGAAVRQRIQVDQLEALAGMDFFTALADGEEASLEGRAAQPETEDQFEGPLPCEENPDPL